MSSADDPLKASRILFSAWTHASFFLAMFPVGICLRVRRGQGFAPRDIGVVGCVQVVLLGVIGSIIVGARLCA